MWIRTVDFPSELIEAHRAGQLVIFVGAGASMDAPASLPSFNSLIERIGGEAESEPGEADWDRPDVFLGRLVDMDFDVHGRINAHVDLPDSEPNSLHLALARLAVSGPPPRVVTTNYDRHLSTALTNIGASYDEYVGPALPVGDDFTGVVYLHGKLGGPPERLIATDKDFGRAYLRDAWAARFLERMFAEFTVLFVGYSLNDLIVSYLTRSLGRGKRRFVLTCEPDKDQWKALGVLPIKYELDGESHVALGDAVEGWASLASAKFLDHRQRVEQLLSVPPTLIPEDESYLEATLAEPNRVVLFTEFARGQEWLAWAARRPQFERLFDPHNSDSEITWSLAQWFVEHYAASEEHSRHALDMVRERRSRLGPHVCEAIGRELHRHGTTRPSWMRPWLALLVSHAPETGVHWLELALESSSWDGDRSTALLLFDHLTEPRLASHETFGFTEASLFEVRLRGSIHALDEAWQQIFRPNLDDGARELLAIADRHFLLAHNLLRTAESARQSFGRSAIEPHEQDRFRDRLDPLIDAARDSLEALLRAGSAVALGYLEAWADSDVEILKRLAIHGWTCRADVDDTRKITWLRGRQWLYELPLRHEVFRLVARSLPGTALEVADGLVEDVIASAIDRRPYELYNMLVWVNQHAPELRSVRDALDEVQRQYPDFEPREHPDLLAWVSSGFVEARTSVTADELHERIGADATATVSEIREDGPMLELLASTVKAYPDDGVVVLNAGGSERPEIVEAVVGGWSALVVDDPTAVVFLERLRNIELLSVVSTVCRILIQDGIDWPVVPEARELADDLWTVANVEPIGVYPGELAWRALNEPAGMLASFWTRAVAAEWRAAGDSWNGLDEVMRSRLDGMLAVEDERSSFVEAVFAAELSFYFNADRQWATARLIPLFDWSDEPRALRVWPLYLQGGGVNDQLLEAGLLEHSLAAVRHVEALPENLRVHYFNYMADVALSANIHSLTWVLRFTSMSEPQQRVQWLTSITWSLGRLSAEAVALNWDRWMRDYWKQRLQGSPRRLTTDEASAMAGWVEFLGPAIEEAVDLAVAHEAGIRGQAQPGMLHRLDEETVRTAPAAFAKLLAHLLKHTTEPFAGCYHLRGIVSWFRDDADADHVQEILDHAVRLRCGDVSAW